MLSLSIKLKRFSLVLRDIRIVMKVIWNKNEYKTKFEEIEQDDTGIIYYCSLWVLLLLTGVEDVKGSI